MLTCFYHKNRALKAPQNCSVFITISRRRQSGSCIGCTQRRKGTRRPWDGMRVQAMASPVGEHTQRKIMRKHKHSRTRSRSMFLTLCPTPPYKLNQISLLPRPFLYGFPKFRRFIRKPNLRASWDPGAWSGGQGQGKQVGRGVKDAPGHALRLLRVDLHTCIW